MSSPITYTNFKGESATYDPTAPAPKIGVEDVKILVKLGHFPFGKKADGTPYFNACAGKKRDLTDGKFAKGDTCDKCGMVFARAFAKATHYAKVCVERQQGKVRSTKEAPKALPKASPKKTERFKKFMGALVKSQKDPLQNWNYESVKIQDAFKELLDTPLGKTTITHREVYKVEITMGGEVLYKEQDEEYNKTTTTTAKEFVIKAYHSADIDLYPEVQEDDEEEDDLLDDLVVAVSSGSEAGDSDRE